MQSPQARWLVWAFLAFFGLGALADFILDTKDGRALSPSDPPSLLPGVDILLLDEIHDNPAHQQARGRLLAALPAGFHGLVTG